MFWPPSSSIYRFHFYFSISLFLCNDLILDRNSQQAIKSKTTDLPAIKGIDSNISYSDAWKRLQRAWFGRYFSREAAFKIQ